MPKTARSFRFFHHVFVSKELIGHLTRRNLVTLWRYHCRVSHPQRTTQAAVLARVGVSCVLLAATEALACDNELNNTALADAHGPAPPPLACHRDSNLRVV